MTRKKLEVLGAVLTILVLVLLLIWIFAWQPQPDVEPQLDQTPDVIDQVDIVLEEVSGPPIILPNTAARSFVERFGSFSTESDYANVEDVMVLATADLRDRLQVMAEDARREAGGAFYGVSTRVITMNVLDENETSASLAITTQREETFETPANTTVKYQDIQLEMVRVGDEWLISSFLWK